MQLLEVKLTGKIIQQKIFGILNTLVKSFTVKDAPNPSMINAKAPGAIVVSYP